MWDEVLGHQQNKEFLEKLLKPGSRPHALLFYGMGGIGKKMLALHFAKTFLCKSAAERPCGLCESCRLMDIENNSFAHPDFYLLTAEEAGKDIKIEQVKEMAKQAAFAPVLSRSYRRHCICAIRMASLPFWIISIRIAPASKPPVRWERLTEVGCGV